MSDSRPRRMTVREWWENYWYHNKWPTILGAFLVVVFTVCIVQSATRTVPDALLMYSGPCSLSFDSISELKESVVSLMDEDYNGDGVRHVEYLENVVFFEDYSVQDMDGAEQIIINRQEQVEQYITQVVAGDAQIYLLSPAVYAELSKQNVLVPLSELYGSVPVEAHDSASYQLGKLDLYTLPGFCDLPEDTVLCLRVTKTLAVRDKAQAEAEHEWAKQIFMNMIAFQAE